MLLVLLAAPFVLLIPFVTQIKARVREIKKGEGMEAIKKMGREREAIMLSLPMSRTDGGYGYQRSLTAPS